MAEGWISIHRSIFENEIWRDSEPFDYRSAWIDLLLLANHKDRTILYKGNVVEVKRGEVNRSIESLADRWHWGWKKTKKFLKILEKLEMIVIFSTTQGTTISIENYSKFQDVGRTLDTTEGTTQDERRTNVRHINNNDNNDNKDNNYIYKPIKKGGAFTPPSSVDVKAYCLEKGYSIDAEAFCDFYESKGWLVGKNKMKDWKAAVRTWAKREQGRQQAAGDRWLKLYSEVTNE